MQAMNSTYSNISIVFIAFIEGIDKYEKSIIK